MAVTALRDRVANPTRRVMLFRDLMAGLAQDEVAADVARQLIDTLDDGDALFADLPTLGSHEAALAFLKEVKAVIGRLVPHGANQRQLNWKLDVLAGRQVLANQRA